MLAPANASVLESTWVPEVMPRPTAAIRRGGAPPTEAEFLSQLASDASTKRVAIIEGDSWYNFPLLGADGLDTALRKRHGYRYARFSRAGANLLQMVYGGRGEDPDRVIGAIRTVKPRVMLFCGGGNDVVGWEFKGYLNHNESGEPIINQAYADAQFSSKFLPAYRAFIDRILEASPATKIFVHGYAYAFPSGQRVRIPIIDDLGIVRIGPWMKPYLDAYGWSFAEGRGAIIDLIDRLNDMLIRLQTEYAGRFFHVDLRGFATDPADWRDELHLYNKPWALCADEIAKVVYNNVPNW